MVLLISRDLTYIAVPQGPGLTLDCGILGGFSLGSGREETMLGVSVTIREMLGEPAGEGVGKTL